MTSINYIGVSSTNLLAPIICNTVFCVVVFTTTTGLNPSSVFKYPLSPSSQFDFEDSHGIPLASSKITLYIRSGLNEKQIYAYNHVNAGNDSINFSTCSMWK